MSIRSSIQKTFRSLMVAGFLLVPLTVASTAQAVLYIDHIPPTMCKSSQLPYIGDKTQYRNGSISTLPSSSLWDYDIVMCPINRFNPDDEVIQIRLNVEGPNATTGWCQLYEAPNHDASVAFQSAVPDGTNRSRMTFLPPSNSAANGRLALTARCLLFPGDAITSIEVFWDR